LRILDDKVDGKKDFVRNAPKIIDYLSDQEKLEFQKIITLLNSKNIKFELDETLVRGLDYYTNLVFEIISTDGRLSAQPTIIGGGRYSKLVSELGGEDCSCLGFALGIERLLLLCEYENVTLSTKNDVDVVIACLSEQAIDITFDLLKSLRNKNIKAICKFDTFKLAKILTYANKIKSKFIIIIGEKELQTKSFVVKNLDSNKQENLTDGEIINFIKQK
jgi:histidyl-tRNA synthetase